jgi:site-specific recombinase XerD
MENLMILRGMPDRSREVYLKGVAGLAAYYNRRPDQISEEEIQDYLVHLRMERQLAWSTCNIVVNAIRFLFRHVLDRDLTHCRIPYARVPSKLPEILSREEVERLIEHTSRPMHRALLMTAYGAGLRVNELVHLKVRGIDSQRMSIRVEQGKGGKDRYTILSPRLLDELRRYWTTHHSGLWLFPSPKNIERPVTVNAAWQAYTAAKRRAGIAKQGGIHALRHAFATHMLEAGTDLHTIQRLLGHAHISTTMRYFHIAKGTLTANRSPLDLLDLPDPSDD